VNTASSVISDSTVAASPFRLACIQLSISWRIARSSSVIRSSQSKTPAGKPPASAV